jgi:putative phage-type endonuclease
MVKMHTFITREEWLKARKNYIGGSDASAVIGMNPYKTNVDLWAEKTGLVIPEDISDKPYVKYGHDAEPLLRDLFRLDFPEYEVFYEENNMFTNDKYPWGHYSADGWLKDRNGRRGILEIKTTEILQSMQKEKWNHRIPDNYFVQILHGFLIMEADFAVLKAQLKTVFDGIPYLQTRHYFIERSEVEADIEFLQSSEKSFWLDVQNKQRPALILPEF